MSVMSTPNRASAWQDVADDLRARLTAGEYGPGDRLPGRRTLMDQFGVADRTIARALHQLQDEGYILAKPRAGWIVRGNRAVIRATRNRLSRAEREAGRGTFASDLHTVDLVPDVTVDIRFEPASEAVATALRLDPGEQVCVRDRVMRARRHDAPAGSGEVLQLATSHLPRRLTAGTPMESDNSGPGGIYTRLEESGHPLDHFTERVAIGRADEYEAREMNLSVGEPVFRIWRTAWSADQPVEVNAITVTGNRYELLYELPSE